MGRILVVVLIVAFIAQSFFLLNVLMYKAKNDQDNELIHVKHPDFANPDGLPRILESDKTQQFVERIDNLSSLTSEGIQKRTSPFIASGFQSSPSWSDKSSFTDHFKSYVQYVKGVDVQPLMDSKREHCVAPTDALEKLMSLQQELYVHSKNTDNSVRTLNFFTNNIENEAFLSALSDGYSSPSCFDHVDGFKVFSALPWTGTHPFHRHGEAWIGAVSGYKTWWFLPPDAPRPKKVPACQYKGTGPGPKVEPPEGALRVVQGPGDIIWVPDNWWHATCSDSDWTVGIGAQKGNPKVYKQGFPPLKDLYKNKHNYISDEAKFRSKMTDCGLKAETNGEPPQPTFLSSSTDLTSVGDISSRIWFNGDLNEYYNKLEQDEHKKRKPNIITSYAVHRWMGPQRSTLEHYKLIQASIQDAVRSSNGNALKVLDAGCGLGAGLMWFEQNEPTFQLVGRTISEDQYKWIVNDLPTHNFEVALKSYDDIDPYTFDVIYSIEALIHTPDLKNTLKIWSEHLAPGAVVIVVDDFLSVGTSRNDEEVDLFAKSWLANSLVTTPEYGAIARSVGLEVVQDRDLVTEYNIIALNYRNQAPDIKKRKEHQGWLAASLRRRLTVHGKLTYRMIVLRKPGGFERRSLLLSENPSSSSSGVCTSVPTAKEGEERLSISPIAAELRTGHGNNKKMKCISGWYCCDKGGEIWDDLDATRTSKSGFLQLDRDLFGHYLVSFSYHLDIFYSTLQAGAKGKFLDIGGTGSVASGMTQVSSKFAHWSGPFEYLVLDSDPAAKGLSNAIVCDITNCPEANDCEFDVTFSHTVLEHASKPWETFDTIARITKKGGLTMHLVPWSYQYHATPDDYYRFSHSALRNLLEERGFEVLDVGYDVCTKPEQVLRNRKDEHYDVIWLTYVVGKKL